MLYYLISIAIKNIYVHFFYANKRKRNVVNWLDRIHLLCFSLKQSASRKTSFWPSLRSSFFRATKRKCCILPPVSSKQHVQFLSIFSQRLFNHHLRKDVFGRWATVYSAPVVMQPLGTARQEILDVLEKSHPKALSVKTLAEEMPEIGNVKLRKTVKRMAADGQIQQSARGEYCAFSASPPSLEHQELSHLEHSSQVSQQSQCIRAEEELSHLEHSSQVSQQSQCIRDEKARNMKSLWEIATEPAMLVILATFVHWELLSESEVSMVVASQRNASLV